MARNAYINGTYEEAVERDYDILQLKYDGWWCRAEHAAGHVDYFSETDRNFLSTDIPGLDGCTIIGEYMRGTQWSQHPDRKGLFFIYDLRTVFGEPLTHETYSTRYRLLRRLPLPVNYRLVECFPIKSFDSTWQHYVLDQGFEGVVFRRSESTLDDPIMRHKREYTLDGVVVGFTSGRGKYEGSLGAVRVVCGEAITDVGGGFSDVERQSIWNNQTAYIGRVMEFTANAVFESGAPRHPRFVRWREDKT